MRSGFRIEGDLEDAICGFYVALLANATGEAVVYARAGDEDPERFTTRAPDELCTWIEQRVERDWDVYGTLLTSAGELVGVRRRILAGMRAPTAPVPPSLSLETDEGNVIEVWLFDRALSSNNPIVTALQRSIEPERADGELQVPIPGVPSARARLLTPESATDLYERKIPYYSTRS